MEIHCNRCTKNLTLFVKLAKNDITLGYYGVSGGFWSQFADKHETYVCDECMWKDQRYINVYGRYSE